jgi:hypothetical protein
MSLFDKVEKADNPFIIMAKKDPVIKNPLSSDQSLKNI